MSWWRRVRTATVWPMLWKEFLQVRRDRFTLGMMVGIPAIQLALFGYAIQTEVRHQPLLVADQARTPESRALVAAMINTGNFDLVGEAVDAVALTRAIGAGEARAGLVIPPDYARHTARGETATAQILVDASDPIAANGAMAAAQQAGLVRSQALARAGRPAAAAAVQVRVRPLYNPAVRSAVYVVPGIVGVLLSITMILIASMSVVRERERGTLEQLVVTPIGKTSLMIGKMAPFLIIGYVQISVILVLGGLLFRVPFQGSVPLLYLMALPFILASLALGLFISTLVRTQAQAMQLGFFFMLPNILLSGFMFPREAMPEAAQWISAALPLTYFLKVLRGILLKGVGLEALWPEVLVLSGFTVVLVSLAVARFRKGLE